MAICFPCLIASTFLPFLPMLPLQLLFLNLIYDVSCISLPWDRMDKEYLDEPKNGMHLVLGNSWFTLVQQVRYLILLLTC
ncbi:hypothetical protein B1P95_21355 [Enterococcus faecium]|uniref:Cation-transporting P-type ATPase C-terminal domain-containing protein n=1 Tax=Enterococcus faecium TaxID=1352 RepID=A0A1S8IWJ6_ENTFC|nr:hypothetical protein B1P95_21355 [Enterococcus faecium]